MWGRQTPKPTPADDAGDTADLAEAALEHRLRSHVAKEPGFRITTVDGLHWICPYTLTLVSSPFDPVETAVQHLFTTKPWLTGKPKPLGEILIVKWRHWLRERWEFEPHLRQFGPDGRWLNPFTGAFEDRLKANARQTPEQLVTAMASLLAGCAQAQQGNPLPTHRLEEVLAAARLAQTSSDPSRASLPVAPLIPVARSTPPAGVQRGGLSQGTERPERPRSASTSDIIRIDAQAQANGQLSTDSLNRAQRVIAKILPDLPTIPGYDIAVAYEPMDGIGGDFYDFITLSDGRMLIFLGDVSGHGPEAALVVTSAIKALRMIAPRHHGLVELLAEFNDNVRQDLPAGMFITAWVAILDPSLSSITAVCCGHHPALLASLHRQTTLQQFGQKGTALGLLAGTQVASTWRPETTQLRPGDLLLQFTDGLFEVHHTSGIEFGALRAWGSCIANLEYPPSQVVARMVKEVKKFGNGVLEDDLTLLAIGLGHPSSP